MILNIKGGTFDDLQFPKAYFELQFSFLIEFYSNPDTMLDF